MEFREQVPLAPFTSFKIGGPARWFVQARTTEEVIEAVHFARTRQIPLFLLGGGSNLLISDGGFDGLVLRVASSGIKEIDRRAGFRVFSVCAGQPWDEFVDFAVGLNCGGIECLAGIPGTVGGTPIQNVGAYGQEASATISKVQVLDLSTLSLVHLDASDCEFGYRRSIFNQQCAGRYAILNVEFRLRVDAPSCIAYRDLKDYFRDFPGVPDLAQTAEAVREIRRRKGMVLVDGDPDTQSAGSFFKNPLVPDDRLGAIAEAAGVGLTGVPIFSAGRGMAKIPAAWLVEKAGIVKGYRKGNAAVSSRHTLALSNRGGATACEVLALSEQIRNRVSDRFGIDLQMEPMLVGF